METTETAQYTPIEVQTAWIVQTFPTSDYPFLEDKTFQVTIAPCPPGMQVSELPPGMEVVQVIDYHSLIAKDLTFPSEAEALKGILGMLANQIKALETRRQTILERLG